MKTTIAIGCLVQWYEVEIVEEYIQSLVDAIKNYSKNNILVDIKLTLNQDLEKPIGSDEIKFCEDRIKLICFNELEGYKLNFETTLDLVSIADYRRDFNNTYCTKADVLVWGETDMLVPKEMFSVIDIIHSQVKQQTPKYLITFSTNKMWDESWQPLEHPNFTIKKHSDSPKDWWGVRYVTSKEEMNRINEDVTDLEVVNISPFKFNGCGLVISSEVIKAGANIPRSVFFVHEDTAFLLFLQKVFPQIPQYHIKNIYLPHNRKHLKKRLYIEGEDKMDKSDIGKLRKSHNWYVKANKYSEENCYNMFNPQHISKTWKDVFNDK